MKTVRRKKEKSFDITICPICNSELKEDNNLTCWIACEDVEGMKCKGCGQHFTYFTFPGNNPLERVVFQTCNEKGAVPKDCRSWLGNGDEVLCKPILLCMG